MCHVLAEDCFIWIRGLTRGRMEQELLGIRRRTSQHESSGCLAIESSRVFGRSLAFDVGFVITAGADLPAVRSTITLPSKATNSEALFDGTR